MFICFVVSNWEKIRPELDTTMRLIHECCVRGHQVGLLYPQNLTIRHNVAYGFIRHIRRRRTWSQKMKEFAARVDFRDELVSLKDVDVLVLRKNPPVDTIMLNFLDSVCEDTLIINDINGIRKANNKLYTATFHDPAHHAIPETHVSKSKTYLKRVIAESTQDRMILKPVNAYGGSGVIVLEKSAGQNINSLLDFYIDGQGQSNYVILQEYVEGAEQGDVRVIMLNGKPVGAVRRVPSPDDIRSNIHAGGTPMKHRLTPLERSLCDRIGQRLIDDGLYLVGLDLIENKLIEINVLNPGGVVPINRLTGTKLQIKIINFMEQKARSFYK